ncbi:MAG: UDP-N-acetylglucosamine-transferase [Ewingella americana]|jgi:glycosyltransferase involved in cell wall biosynthesis|uniref:GlcNAc-transferase family protein n=1 Tax=Ewingella americana TaxID=41202 RepID=UPI0024321246|nr:GlcNAc-transferase family protein [Ewingella americana]MCI1680714.1 UDP-N-acetylglucosamine-transferase [Ewingella americana]MCI1853172.1 UDP-N-acetylglucosamine-transferase [Ewingella americana]MCI1860587.1 UDP-N-acetylglucosamine-transferase [Ewingella americana]MCI2164633.1 UDP-N-acetylglucosamine-transferase [Ewingella americana]MCI2210550.1 UDP-N-acetylglucosamine-transferase [Ewingella americana]
MQPGSTIFVSIASYRDPELIPTLHDMINNAEKPENLNIAIFWQNDNDITVFINQGMAKVETTTYRGYPLHEFECNRARISVISVHYYQSQGACWARYMAEGLFADQDYFLQIDSHCRFIPDWDREMVAMLNSLRGKSPRPVLSSYPPGYVPGEDEDRKTYVSRLTTKSFTPDGMLQMGSVPFNDDAPLRCGYLAGGFIFADGTFARDVPNDPEIFFMGEEIAMAARTFTHGYDIYAPHRILLWHFYTRKEHSKVWGDHSNEAKKNGAVEMAWWERDKVAKSRVRKLLGAADEICDLGHYSLGKQRTLQEFEYRIGANFQQRALHPEVIGKDRISYFAELPLAHEQWLQALIFVNLKTLKIDKSEADFLREDVDFWHIGVYTPDNVELMTKQVDINNMKGVITPVDDSSFEVKLTFNTETSPSSRMIRICPYIRAHGWGDTLEKHW